MARARARARARAIGVGLSAWPSKSSSSQPKYLSRSSVVSGSSLCSSRALASEEVDARRCRAPGGLDGLGGPPSAAAVGLGRARVGLGLG